MSIIFVSCFAEFEDVQFPHLRRLIDLLHFVFQRREIRRRHSYVSLSSPLDVFVFVPVWSIFGQADSEASSGLPEDLMGGTGGSLSLSPLVGTGDLSLSAVISPQLVDRADQRVGSSRSASSKLLSSLYV